MDKYIIAEENLDKFIGTLITEATVYAPVEENDITLIRADWTKPDRNIDIFLKKFNKFGIPFNAFFSSKFSEGIILSELLTEKEIYESIEKLK